MSAALNDNSQLEFTQNLRRKLVEQYTADGKIPEDPKMANLLLSALKDYDKVTLTLKRIDADKEMGDADRQALVMFQRQTAMWGSRDLARTDEPTSEGPAGFNPDEIKPIELVPGELGIGSEALDYDQLVTKLDKEHRAQLEK